MPVYHIQTKEDKRRFRAIIQPLVDNQTDVRTFVFYANEPDLIQVKTGKGTYDVAVSPTEKRKDGRYTPPYGAEMSKAMKSVLKIIEASRSETARCLRHIAGKDEDFIGVVKGGRGRMQRYDQKPATRNDQIKIAADISRLFITTPPSQNKSPKQHLRDLLNTETESASFAERKNKKLKRVS